MASGPGEEGERSFFSEREHYEQRHCRTVWGNSGGRAERKQEWWEGGGPQASDEELKLKHVSEVLVSSKQCSQSRGGSLHFKLVSPK